MGPGTRIREFPRGSDFALIQGASSRPRAARNGFSGAAARPARHAPPAVRPTLCGGRVFRFPVHVPVVAAVAEAQGDDLLEAEIHTWVCGQYRGSDFAPGVLTAWDPE